MKLLIASFLVLFASYTHACSCSEYPLDHDAAIESYIMNRYDHFVELKEEDVQWIAYYPSILERIEYPGMRGTSCEGRGPNDEIMLHCSNSRKSDYKIKLQRRKCEVVLRVKSTFTNISIKELSSTCKR